MRQRHRDEEATPATPSIPPMELLATTLQLCRNIQIASWQDESDDELRQLRSGLLARANGQYNSHLRRLFGINDALTTSVPARRKELRDAAVDSMCYRRDNLGIMAKLGSLYLKQNYSVGHLKTTGLKLVPMVQTLVLDAVLALVFPDNLTFDGWSVTAALHAVTTDIDRVFKVAANCDGWRDDKRALKKIELANQNIKRHTTVLVSDTCEGSIDQPFDGIFHAYEMLWPVVLRSYLEMFRGIQDKANSKRIHVVREALRMYPPVQRIQRFYEWGAEVPAGALEMPCTHVPQQAFSSSTTIPDLHCTADVLQLQRKSDTPEFEGLKFKPARWVQDDNEQLWEENCMPFGHGELSCPFADFAPELLSKLLNTLMLHLHAKDDKHGCPPTMYAGLNQDESPAFLQEDVPLSMEREAFHDIVLKRRPTAQEHRSSLGIDKTSVTSELPNRSKAFASHYGKAETKSTRPTKEASCDVKR